MTTAEKPEKPVCKAAKNYRDSGVSFFPLRQVKGDKELSKTPASDALKAVGSWEWATDDKGQQYQQATWKPYQDRLPKDEELATWFNNGKDRNIAIVMGRVSRGLIAVDFDDKDAFNQWATAHPEIASKTAIQETDKGYHVLFRMDDPPGNGKFEYAGKTHDIRGEGGYICGWPSIHGSGRKYEWLPGQAPWEIGVMTINSLADVGINLDSNEPPAPVNAPAAATNSYNPLDVLKAIASISDPAIRQKLLDAANSILIKTAPAKPIEVLSADKILQTTWGEPVCIIPDYLHVGLGILAGRPKIGKSWLALQVAQAVASGGKLFDKEVTPGPVLYLALEDTPRRLQNRMTMQNWPNGLPADFMTLGDFDSTIGNFANGGADVLARLIQSKGYRLVIIDTLARALRNNKIKDARSSVEMTAALAPIQEMAHKCNCAVVMIDHMRKMGGADPDVITDTMDSISKTGVCDTAWGLYRERGKTEAKLQITGRDVDEVTLALKMDWFTACWQSEGDYFAMKVTERRQEILDALDILGRATLQKIADTVGQNKGNTLTRLKDMVVSGLVTQLPDGDQITYERKK